MLPEDTPKWPDFAVEESPALYFETGQRVWRGSTRTERDGGAVFSVLVVLPRTKTELEARRALREEFDRRRANCPFVHLRPSSPRMTLVREFHEKYGLEHPQHPEPGNVELLRLRKRLITEEYREVATDFDKLIALMAHGQPGADRVDAILALLGSLLKELADLRYVLEGAAVSFGLDIDGAFEAVHESNMTKDPPRDGGKARKGADYVPPDMLVFVPAIIEVDPEEDSS